MEIEIDLPSFYSHKDESVLFDWISEIKSIYNFRGRNRQLILDVSDKWDENDLREFIAVLTRFSISKKPLVKLLNGENEHWFKDRAKYWFKEIFENPELR